MTEYANQFKQQSSPAFIEIFPFPPVPQGVLVGPSLRFHPIKHDFKFLDGGSNWHGNKFLLSEMHIKSNKFLFLSGPTGLTSIQSSTNSEFLMIQYSSAKLNPMTVT